MTESIEDIIKAGYRTWRDNIILGIPFLLSGIINVVIIVALVFFLIFVVGYSAMSPNGFNMSTPMLLVMGLATTAAIFLMLLVGSFFEAGAIGMAKKAIRTGSTSFNDMLAYGGKKFLSLFFASILISLIVFFVIVLLLIPVVAAFISGLINVGLSLSVLSLALLMLFDTALSIILIPVSYTIIVSDLGAIEGIRRGCRFFMKNKLSVLFLLFVTKGVMWACGLIINLITSLIGVIPIIGAVINWGVYLLYAISIVMVLVPVFTVWWTRLYMDRTDTKLWEEPIESYPRAPVPEPETLTQESFYI
ncbi:MAG: hypothetical protein JW778_04275 [Candidatus Altiarchaeota archaeon]|nr:hypothetical protein [Candidatus Altiarchaeota archaeon]